MTDDDFCTGSHDWTLGDHSGIDLCRNCPAGRTRMNPGDPWVIHRAQLEPPYGY